MKHLSLFAGIGGIDLGFERAGINTVMQVEIDTYCQKVLAKNFPLAKQWPDIKTFPIFWAYSKEHIDVVSAGFPCQPFSLAGKKLGTEDDRWLWPQTVTALRYIQPKYVLLENVDSLIGDSEAFGIVLSDLHSLGFNAEWTTFSAADFGAPHNRRRVYVLAYPASNERITRHLLEQGGIGRSSESFGRLFGDAASSGREAEKNWLKHEPKVDRLVDGFPTRMDQLKGLGNAVVPAVAEYLGYVIQELEGV